MRLKPTSTLSLWSSFDIEPFFDLEGLIFWFDRANIGVLDPLTGTRTTINPDGGRTYNVPENSLYGSCSTANEAGWAGSQETWDESTWSASALGSAALAGKAVQIDINYGTDDGLIDGKPRDGFWFDRVTVTDIEALVEDSQSNICSAPICDADLVCEAGETSCNCAIDSNSDVAPDSPLGGKNSKLKVVP